MPSSRFQAPSVINKQESLTNKDQHPSFKLACLNFLEDPTPLLLTLHVTEQLAKSMPDAYLTRKFNVMVPARQTKSKGPINRKLLENFKNSCPH